MDRMLRNRKGFVLALPLGFWALIATIGMFWVMLVDMASRRDSPVQYRDEQFDPASQ